VDGLSWCYSGLLQHIRTEYPIYGLQARSFNQPEILPRTLQEMVADYLEQIRAIQPAGPYHLLGWSFGGLVAYSLANHLQLQGEQVALLALLDTYPPDPEVPYDVLGEQERIQELIKELGYDPAALGQGTLRLSTLKEVLRRQGHIPSNFEERHLSAIARTYNNNVRLAHSFIPETFDGDLVLFVAVEDNPAPPKDAWRPYVGGQLRVHQIASAHARMTEPGPLAEIGRLLAAELEKASQQPRINPTNK
jgi:nonribosomal peptide synthetase DhbF